MKTAMPKNGKKRYGLRAIICLLASDGIFMMMGIITKNIDEPARSILAVADLLAAIICMILGVIFCVKWIAAKLKKDTSAPVKPDSLPHVPQPKSDTSAPVQPGHETKSNHDTKPGHETRTDHDAQPESQEQPDAPAYLPHIPQPKSDTEWLQVPDLRKAIEKGLAGKGVQYYYFESGLLTFVGDGETASMKEGQQSGTADRAPWSEKVSQGARRLIVSQGVTAIGDGLLNSLKNLEEINLANSVNAIGFNTCRKVHILRAGKAFKSCEAYLGDLTELRLPDAPVHLGTYDEGRKCKLQSSTGEIYVRINKKIIDEFLDVVTEMFQECPEIGDEIKAVVSMDGLFSYEQLYRLRSNGMLHRKVTEMELWKTAGIMPKDLPKEKLEIDIRENKDTDSLIILGALVLLMRKQRPLKAILKLNSSYTLPEEHSFAAWWNVHFPMASLQIINAEDGSQRMRITESQTEPVLQKLDGRYLYGVYESMQAMWVCIDYVLTGRYGYNTMLKVLSSMPPIDKVWTAPIVGAREVDRTEEYRADGIQALSQETGVISFAGNFDQKIGPTKIVMINQTDRLRVYQLYVYNSIDPKRIHTWVEKELFPNALEKK
ncbi:MAG: hypothetical protein Q4B09_08455 [Lachnospiraceae bacterium]|nr:hypothetical protein [Lachnospiraceae bacterium]